MGHTQIISEPVIMRNPHTVGRTPRIIMRVEPVGEERLCGRDASAVARGAPGAAVG
jgi:hypothetical protein